MVPGMTKTAFSTLDANPPFLSNYGNYSMKSGAIDLLNKMNANCSLIRIKLDWIVLILSKYLFLQIRFT